MPDTQLVDVHAHICDPAFDPDRADVLARAQRAGVAAIVAVGENLNDARKNVALAEIFPMLKAAAGLLHRAADLAESADFANYLKLRAGALITDEYQLSDLYWMDVKDNEIDLVIGPIETYEDALYGYRAAYEAYVLLKDMDWSAQLARYATFLPELQAGLPVPDDYKQDTPGSDSDLNAYDVIYYAGDSNAGAKTIAINLPNDERVIRETGSKRVMLKNTQEAKFRMVLVPLSKIALPAAEQGHARARGRSYGRARSSRRFRPR